MGWALLGLVALAARLPGADGAAPPPAEAKAGDASHVVLSPEVQKRMDVLLGHLKDKKIEFWNDRLLSEIDEIAKNPGLSADGRKTLHDAAKPAVAAAFKDWKPHLPEEFLQTFALMPKEQALAVLDQADTQLDALAATNWTGDAPDPDTIEPWTASLHQALTPAQFAAWGALRQAKRDKAAREIADDLKAAADRAHDVKSRELSAKSQEIETALHLPPDRAAQLDAAAKSAVDEGVAKWQERARKFLLTADDNTRRMFSGNGYEFVGWQEDEEPVNQPAWKNGVAKILTPDEQAQLQDVKMTARKAREAVMARIMVALLDEKLALTAAQRAKLEPLVAPLIPHLDGVVAPENSDMGQIQISPDSFFQGTRQIADSSLTGIFDRAQLARWHQLSSSETPDQTTDGDTDAGNAPTDAPQDVDAAISDFMYRKSLVERKHLLESQQLKTEDVARTTHLDAATTERLETAARGDTERRLDAWKWFVEQQVRSQVQGATLNDVKQRLQGIQSFFFQRNYGVPEDEPLWDNAVQAALTPEQQAAWQRESDARAAYRADAVAALVVLQMDHDLQLSTEQRQKLQPLVADVITHFSEGMARVFSWANNTPWYLAGPYIGLPMAGVDDGQLKSILRKDQYDTWTTSPNYSNAMNLWQVVKQNQTQHERAKSRSGPAATRD
jgi:hypothetical protein